MELTQARLLADQIVESAKIACDRIEVAGSIRRQKENVKDIELVAIVKDYDLFFSQLEKHGRFIKPGVPDIIPWPPKKGAKYVRMLINEEIKLDIFVASEINWGSLLFMRTGPAVAPNGAPIFQAFVPAAFARFKRISKGGKMTQCMPTMPDGTQLEVREEKDFFDILGIEWIEPKDRIDVKSMKKITK